MFTLFCLFLKYSEIAQQIIYCLDTMAIPGNAISAFCANFVMFAVCIPITMLLSLALIGEMELLFSGINYVKQRIAKKRYEKELQARIAEEEMWDLGLDEYEDYNPNIPIEFQ